MPSPAATVFTNDTSDASVSAGRRSTAAVQGGRRRDPVDGDAAPHQVVAGRRGGRSGPAELAACTMSGSTPAARSLASSSSNRASCSAGVGVAGLVGHRQVGADALQPQLGQLADRPGQAQQVLGPAPHPVHARVDLEVDRHRRRPRRRGRSWPPRPRSRGCRGPAGRRWRRRRRSRRPAAPTAAAAARRCPRPAARPPRPPGPPPASRPPRPGRHGPPRWRHGRSRWP